MQVSCALDGSMAHPHEVNSATMSCGCDHRRIRSGPVPRLRGSTAGQPDVGHSSTGDRVELPAPGHPLQHVLTSVIELNARANNEVLDGARDEDLVR
jgi:hypothetical protein